MTNPILNVDCPTCGKKKTWNKDNKYKPFCSERCKMIDLGEWASESRRIAGDDAPNSDEDEE